MPTEPSERLNALREVQARNRLFLYWALGVFLVAAAVKEALPYIGG